jgi:hypothetical protein
MGEQGMYVIYTKVGWGNLVKHALAKLRRRWEDKLKMDYRELGWENGS